MFVEDNPNASLDDILTHFGVKGMKWGVRHDPELIGLKSGGKANTSKGGGSTAKHTLSDNDKALLAKLGFSEHDSAHIQAKYGPGSLGNEPPKGHLTPQQKKILAGVAVGVGVAAAAAAAYYLHGRSANPDLFKDFDLEKAKKFIPKAEPDPLKNPPFQKEWRQYMETAGLRQFGYSKEVVDKLSDTPTHLKAGTIFKRVSTEMEKDIRPGGFFASHDDADVERYKAILPVFWKQWGYRNKDGFVVNIRANADIKAPSPKHTFEMFKSILNDDIEAPNPWGGGTMTMKAKELFMVARGDDDSMARDAFPGFAAMWAHGNSEHPVVKHFFDKVKDSGFNALPDMNDAGALSKNPMRLLDGNMFSVIGHDVLSKEAIRTAQDNIQALVHAMSMGRAFFEPLRGGSMTTTHQEQLGIDFLEHYGVVGMKWGKHRVKADSYDIRAARGRQLSEKTKLQKAKKDAAHIKDPVAREMAKAKVAEMKTAFLKNPDRVAAARLTRGEKAVALLLTVPTGGLAGIAAIGITSATSRRIERKQEKGKYDKNTSNTVH